MRSSFALLSLAALASLNGCSSSTDPSPTMLVLLPGQETDAFTRSPVPDHVTVRTIDGDGNVKTLVTAPWPASAIDLGTLDQSLIASFEVEASDAAGKTLLRGRSVFFGLWSLAGYEVPVFTSRIDESSRAPGSLPIGRRGGVASVVGGRFIVSAGGTNCRDALNASLEAARISAYDLELWGPANPVLALPRSPLSMAVVASDFGLIVDASGASWYDFLTTDTVTPTAPNGTSFADIAGGATVFAPDGTAYIVGATRDGAPTKTVLVVAPTLTLSAVQLSTARAGAAATWVPGAGLVVIGGSPDGPGVEVLAASDGAFVSLPYPGDSNVGAGAAPVDATHLVLAGGTDASGSTPAPTRTIDLACAAACVPTALSVTFAKPVVPASVFSLGSNAALVVGEELAEGNSTRTAAFLLESLAGTPTLREVPLREPRSGAIAVPLWDGTVGILNGEDPAGTSVRSVEVIVLK